jgi:hypothetical protein
MTLLYKDHDKYKDEAIAQLGELIAGLKEMGIFDMKSREDALDKIRHTTLLDDWVKSEIEPDVLDVYYKQIETSIYFTESGAYIALYVEYWDDDEQYEYAGEFYPEQRKS